jgi:hypothetical protein
MSYELIYRADLSSAHSPLRIVAQPDGREVGWINRFLDPCCVRDRAGSHQFLPAGLRTLSG